MVVQIKIMNYQYKIQNSGTGNL